MFHYHQSLIWSNMMALDVLNMKPATSSMIGKLHVPSKGTGRTPKNYRKCTEHLIFFMDENFRL